jgi:hypothetical protein
MATEHKVPNAELLQAGLALAEQAGRPLKRIQSKGRAMLYEAPDRTTVRVRTCNDHVLVVLAESPAPEAALNIEGTDHLLIVMPENPRSRGAIVAYLVPTEVAVQAARASHKEWLASNPNTAGKNRTWTLWFDDIGPSKANAFAEKWATYRLRGSIDLNEPDRAKTASRVNGSSNSLGQVIAAAKRQIASAAGVPESAVRITIDLA